MSYDPLLKETATADGSGAATVTLGRVGFNGLVAEIHVKPIGSVNANSVATVTLAGGSGATVKSSTSIASAVFLIQLPNDHFFISVQERLTINISGATSGNKFNVSAKVIPLD